MLRLQQIGAHQSRSSRRTFMTEQYVPVVCIVCDLKCTYTFTGHNMLNPYMLAPPPSIILSPFVVVSWGRHIPTYFSVCIEYTHLKSAIPKDCLQKRLLSHGLLARFFMCGWTKEEEIVHSKCLIM